MGQSIGNSGLHIFHPSVRSQGSPVFHSIPSSPQPRPGLPVTYSDKNSSREENGFQFPASCPDRKMAPHLDGGGTVGGCAWTQLRVLRAGSHKPLTCAHSAHWGRGCARLGAPCALRPSPSPALPSVTQREPPLSPRHRRLWPAQSQFRFLRGLRLRPPGPLLPGYASPAPGSRETEACMGGLRGRPRGVGSAPTCLHPSPCIPTRASEAVRTPCR